MTTWEGLIKSVRAKVKGTKVKIRLGASSGEWKAMVADEAARTTFAKNIKTVLERINWMALILILSGRKMRKNIKIIVWLS